MDMDYFFEQNKINDSERLLLKAVASNPLLKEAYNNLGNLMSKEARLPFSN